jgi:hypothetical protein
MRKKYIVEHTVIRTPYTNAGTFDGYQRLIDRYCQDGYKIFEVRELRDEGAIRLETNLMITFELMQLQ